MSEHENVSGFDFDSVFSELVGEHGEQDAGIAHFERQIESVERNLREKLVGTAAGFDTEIAEMFEEALESQWEHHGEVATVTGRVYLADPDLQELIPAAWGEPIVTDDGYVTYYLEDQRLRSHGVEAIPDFEDGQEKATNVRVGYVFSLEGDDFEREIITIYPGELSRHTYETPTTIEAGKRMQRHYPDETQLIDTLLKPDNNQGLSHRLSMLARRIQGSLLESDEFRDIAERYINGRLMLHPELPYVITAKKRLSIFDGTDITTLMAPNQWQHLVLDEPVTLMAYEPRVHFSQHDDGNVYAHILAISRSMEGEEFFSVQSSEIAQFHPTFTYKSLAARAIDGAHLVASLEDDMRHHHWVQGVKSQGDAIKAIPQKEERATYINGKPRQIVEMEEALARIELIMKGVREGQTRIFDSPEAARKAASEYVNEHIIPNIRGLVAKNVEMEFSGPGVIKPNVMQANIPGMEDDDEDENVGPVFALRVDPQHRDRTLEPGDTLVGIPTMITPLSREMRDQDGDTIGYTMYPCLVVNMPLDEHVLSHLNGVDLAEVSLQKRALVPLDGTATIKNQVVELFHQSRTALAEIDKHYHGMPVVGAIRRLNNALLSENPTEYTQLRNIDVIRSVGKTIDAMTQADQDTLKAMNALDAILINRVIMVSGDVYKKTAEGEYELEDTGDPAELTRFEVADVKSSVIGTRPAMVVTYNRNPNRVRNQTQTYYIPLDTIRAMQF